MAFGHCHNSILKLLFFSIICNSIPKNRVYILKVNNLPLRCQMKYDDSELIQQTLDGDEQAFTTLMKKYQKQVHALAWQKIGDFHIAQEIMQDTFLTAYQKLSTLANPNRFAGWLYVITNRKCIAWHRKKKPQPQSLEDTADVELEEAYYSDYMSKQREDAAHQKRRDMVQKLLNTLQESERTVVNLYYIAEMECEQIGKFLGVSPNTVRSRLHRARNKMKKEESMIKENLSSFQLPTQLTENIMKKISQVKPLPPSGSKPLIPFTVSAASAILILFLLGLGVQNQVQYQQPYNLDAASESTIEIVDAPIFLKSPTEPTVKNKVGFTNITNDSNNAGQNPDTTLIDTTKENNGISDKKGQWIETKGPVGGVVVNLYATVDGDVYAGTQSGIFRFSDDKSKWELINHRDIFSHREQMSGMRYGPMVERDGILYLASNREILSSKDRGQTWSTFSVHPGGGPIGIVILDDTFYLCLSDEFTFSGDNGVYRSDDNGASWDRLTLFDKRYPNIEPRAITVIENTVFVGTNKGLYRLDGNTWEQIFLDEIGRKTKYLPIISMEAIENVLYVARSYHIENGFRLFLGDKQVHLKTIDSYVELEETPWTLEREIFRAQAGTGLTWELFVSSDLGTTWEKITPRKNNTNKKELSIVNLFKVIPPNKNDIKNKETISSHKSLDYSPLKIAVTNNKIMLVDQNKHYYTFDSGETWKTQDSTDFGNASTIVMVNENTYYRCGEYGIQRTTDGGESWNQFNNGLVNTDIWQLIAVNGTLYANSIDGFVHSIDGGETWMPINGDTGFITRIMESNGNIYVRDDQLGAPRFFHLSTQDNSLISIPALPVLDQVDPWEEIPQLTWEEIPQLNRPFFHLSTQDNSLISIPALPVLDQVDPWEEIPQLNRPSGYNGRSIPHGDGYFSESQLGGIAVVNGTYYIEYNYQLFRWKPGNTEWFNTGLIDKGISDDRSGCYANNKFIDAVGFRFAVSEYTIYVGEKEGQLMRSLDEGLTWNDVTENLPYFVDHFKAIVLADTFVYVATDKGVIRSSDGIDWQIITDEEGKPLIITMFAVDGTTVYGEAKNMIYKVNSDNLIWQPVTPKILYVITCLDVDNNTLYVGTRGRGVLRYALDK